MKYCVIKDTTKILDGSENHQEMMIKNAENAGFTESEVEILTEEEFEARKALEPIPPQPLTEIEQLRVEQAQSNVEMIDLMMAMMMGGM
jgi:hypothetical protein